MVWGKRCNFDAMEKNAGISLIVFTVLIFFTMVLHPAGGSFEHLLKITSMIVVTHTVAIFSIPFAAIGFWGLTSKLGTRNFFAVTAFAVMALSLVAVLLAGTSNGIVLPLFIQHYRDAGPAVIESIQPILKYNSAVNRAFDYIYTGGFCLAILFWSIAILSTRLLPRWLAWMGIVLATGIIILFGTALGVQQLQGLRVFITGIVAWILAAALLLIKKN